MKTFTVLLVITSLTLTSLGRSFEPYRPNGWYYITSGAQDSLSVEPIVTTKDFVSIRLDSFMSERTDKMAYQIVGRVNDQSIKIWADATEQSIGKHIGFVCNNKVVCNPLVNARIESGNFAISGEGPEFKAMYRQIQEDIKKHGKRPASYGLPSPTPLFWKPSAQCLTMQSVPTTTTRD